MMKAQTLNNRLKEKDACDIFYCVVDYPGGLEALINEIQAFADHPLIHSTRSASCLSRAVPKTSTNMAIFLQGLG
jgi:hypothetical protein